ncbi:MAG: DNA polymerase III subunit gamma/tau [Synechococcaceae cyanobacterium SM2_3_2]|nr:DNA polymerase III subunit gamma/tau [Synechococcaceae cyanobacterium SM2_3_2]
MAYEPLHLKYRPQRFADVVGQSAVVATLSNAIRKGRIAPAYLFCGPRGTGKTSSARILAKSLNCVNGPTPEPCGICDQCRSITRGTALDVIEIDAASNTGVDNIRELIERVQFSPVSSRYKVYVVDECHMLSTSAFNALLKTLEEPPDRVVFVLATTDPQRVLPTVISRCQRFDYRRIPLEAMVAHLAHIAHSEGIPATTETLNLIAQISQGGLRDAEALLDQLSLLDGTIEVDAVWDLVGSVPEQHLLALTDAITHRDPEQVLSQTRQLMDAGKEPLLVLQNLAAFYRDLALAKTAPQRREMVALTQPTWEAILQRMPDYDIEYLLHTQSHLRQAEPQLRQSGQPRLWLEITLMGLLENPATAVVSAPSAPARITPSPPQPLPAPASATPSATPSATATSTSIPQSTPGTPPAIPLPSPPQPTVESPTVTPSATPAITLHQHWHTFLAGLSPVASARLRMGQIMTETPSSVVIGFPSSGFVTKVKSSHGEVQQAVEALLGRSVEIRFEVAKPGASQISPPPPISPAPIDRDPFPPPIPPPPAPTSPVTSSPKAPPLSSPALGASLVSDDLEQAVKRFADFFNGTVISDQADSDQADEDPAVLPGDLPVEPEMFGDPPDNFDEGSLPPLQPQPLPPVFHKASPPESDFRPDPKWDPEDDIPF